jgi:hypothetical protein
MRSPCLWMCPAKLLAMSSFSLKFAPVPLVDLLAPGMNIVSAIPGSTYATMLGTSMGRPFGRLVNSS